MSRIQTNVSSLIAQRVLTFQNRGLVTSLERLSTGLAINRGADDPAGLIVSENLRSEKVSLAAAIGNAQRAEQVVNVAEGGLQEINNLLLQLQSLVGESANEGGVSADEKAANQLQIDSILQTIDRVANSTSFNGLKLLNGNFDYTLAGVANTITDVTVNAARLSDAAGSFIPVTVDVLTSAQTGLVFVSTGTTAAGGDGLVNGGNGSITVEITGNAGVQQFTFASGSSQANITSAINTFKDSLGVSASAADLTGAATDGSEFRVVLSSIGFGSSEFVRVKILEGTSANLLATTATGGTSTADLKDPGRDATVLINGNQATAVGTTARVSTDGFDLTVNIDGKSSLNTTNGSTGFTITGGGADFNLSPQVNLAGKVSIGIETVTTGNLGNSANGYLSRLKSGGIANVINGNLTNAQEIVDASIRQVSSLRGRLGAFQGNVVQATINNLSVTLENTAAAESTIRDTDYAEETAELTRRQILAQAATQSLAIANAQPQSILQLLG